MMLDESEGVRGMNMHFRPRTVVSHLSKRGVCPDLVA